MTTTNVPDIKLLLADVDGTLVTEDKVLTERAVAAVKALREAGIRFAVTSGRPPRGMAMLTGPGWGRFAPAPLLIPYAGDAIFALDLLFPLAGVIRDWRVQGRVHPAYWWGIGAMFACHAVITVAPHTPAGRAIFHKVTEGTPVAAKAPLDYPAFPPGFPIPHP